MISIWAKEPIYLRAFNLELLAMNINSLMGERRREIERPSEASCLYGAKLVTVSTMKSDQRDYSEAPRSVDLAWLWGGP